MKISLNEFLGKIKSTHKPSYGILIVAFLMGLMVFNIWVGLFSLAVTWVYDRMRPPELEPAKGIMTNRTKNAINVICVILLFRMFYFYIKAAELDQYNNVGWATGVSTEWAFGSSTNYRFSINFFSIPVVTWLAYQASLANKMNQNHWRWVFIGFAVIFLPFIRPLIGPMWLLANLGLIIVLIFSIFKFRLPREWPSAKPTDLHVGPTTSTESFEAELTSLKRLFDSGILNEEEFSTKKQEVMQRYKESN